ncbi:hypothetical protein PIROE2DRAFT_12540 [Piromyces sp. E2]|nr:hypothetical protein PIROE2DRAFT_12540 [Piromyces sp. E2]|eukprot:OUM61440.1 hypothetical protein PIROE2DRAFT_12540 [Piromyces sp. E2]
MECETSMNGKAVHSNVFIPALSNCSSLKVKVPPHPEHKNLDRGTVKSNVGKFVLHGHNKDIFENLNPSDSS